MAEEKPTNINIPQNQTTNQNPNPIPPTIETGKIAININPTKSLSFSSLLSGLRTVGFRNLINLGVESLSTENPEQSTAFYLHTKGVKSEKLAEKVRTSTLLTDPQKKSLLKVTQLMSNLEIAEPKRFEFLRDAWLEPEVEFVEYGVQPIPQVAEQVMLIRQEQFVSLSPVELQAQIGQNPIMNFAKGYLEDFAKKKLTNLSEKAGEEVVKKVAEKAGEEVVKKVAETGAKLALKETVSTLIASIGVAAGPFAPIVIPLLKAVGWLLTEALFWVASKIKKNARKYAKEIASFSIGLLAFGVMAGSAPLMVVGGLGLAATGAALGGIGATTSAAIATFTGLASVALSTFLAAFATATGIFLISTIIIVALTLVIINQSAYVVPHNPSALIPYEITSPYIDVKKVAEPSGPFENDQLSKIITYTITITPKKGSLTNISFQSNCSVIQDNSNPPPCPAEENIAVSPPPIIPTGEPTLTPTFPPKSPGIITPSEPYTITYTQRFEDVYRDSLIIDSFTVIADAPGQAGATATGSKSIVIGNPPEDCPSGWPVEPEGLETSISIIQGPQGGYSHRNTESIDFNTTPGHIVRARHSGTASIRQDSCYGKHVDIVSICNGVQFISRYAHLYLVLIDNGPLTSDTLIGISGNTGYPKCSSGPHLHYEFRNSSDPGGNKLYQTDPLPYMEQPWIPQAKDPNTGEPKDIPRGCTGTENCSTVIP